MAEKIVKKNQVNDESFKVTKNLSNENFESSFKSVKVLLGMLGLYIPTGKIDLHRFGYGEQRAWVIVLFGSLLLLADTASCTYNMVQTLIDLTSMNANINDSISKKPLSLLLSIGIDQFNASGYTIIIHSSIFNCIWLVQGNWKRLWINIQEIEHHLNLSNQFYRRIKKKNFYFILLFVGHSLYFLCLKLLRAQLLPPPTGNNIWLSLIKPIWLSMTHFVISAIITLFFVLVSCSADLLTLLKNRLKILIQINKENSLLLASELEKWRHHHAIVCRFIRYVNKCFGAIILIFIGHGFICFITDFYQLFDGILRQQLPFLLTYTAAFIQEFVLLFTIIRLGSNIKAEVCSKSSVYFLPVTEVYLTFSKVGKISNTLYRMDSNAMNSHAQMLVNIHII